jgi:hypothetical protein
MKVFLPKKYRYHVLLGAAITAGCLLLLCAPIRTFLRSHLGKKTTADRPCMTVFIHGSFGPLLGFLSLPDVLNDKVSGTLYRSTTKKMRMDDFFYKGQPILDRGLKQINPTLDLAAIGGKHYAVYPITMAYQIINNVSLDQPQEELIYTFGWSGLMSQQSRRYEAIRLYYALSEEIERLKNSGIDPIIKIITHSHGGNLCLNLAAVQYVLKNHLFDERHIVSSDPDEQDSIEKMATLFSTLTTKELAQRSPDQKIYDYIPLNKNLAIDKLIMLGTPIQPETETFCYAPIFKTVYNFYSDEDQVQKSDWISTKKSLSSARITKKIPSSLAKQGSPAQVIQARIITHELPIKKAPPSKAFTQSVKEEKGLLQQLLDSKSLLTRNSADPTHKELWFLSWEQEQETFNLPTAPLPIVAFVPLITKVLALSKYTDATITLKKTDASFAVTATSNKNLHTTTTVIPLDIVTSLQKKTALWKSPESSQLNEFEAVYKHLGV